MKRILIAALLLAVLLILGVWLYWETEESNHHVLRLAGHIEATETDLGFKVPGKIAAIYFQEGDEVKAGNLKA